MQTTERTSTSNPIDTLIVGAGISGLSLARALNDRPSRQVLVAEARSRVGGSITTGEAEGFLWEEGPNSFAPTPELLELAVDVGLKSELVLADRKLPRFIYWNRRLHPVPMSPPALIGTPLLSAAGKLRLLSGAVGFVPPAIGTERSRQGGEETVAQFFGRHLGGEVTERLVAPFVSGVYAGDPDRLSASAAFKRVSEFAEVGGGLLAGAILSSRQKTSPTAATNPNIPKTRRGELGSFRGGLRALPEAIARSLGDGVRLQWQLQRLHRSDRQTYIAEFSTPDGPERVEARTVVLATPAYASAEILQDFDAEVARALREFPYPPVACAILAYPESAYKMPLRGFGNLIPRGQGIRTLGTIWASSLFPGRAPHGWQSLINFIGGSTDPAIADLDSEQIVKAVHRDLSQILLGANPPQPKVLGVRLWKRAIPQYALGHQDRLDRISTGLQAFPGLYACSNYEGGISLGDCVRTARETAGDIDRYLQRRDRQPEGAIAQ